jgi:hypothetical protein
MSLNESTLIRLILVIVLAIAVRQLVLRLGSKALEKRQEKDRKQKRDHNS